MPVIGRLMYLVLGAVLCLAVQAAHAQPVTRAEFDALNAKHTQLVRYTADLATGMLLIDQKRKALEAQAAVAEARALKAETQIEAQRLLINADRMWLTNFGCNWNGLVDRIERWSKTGQFNQSPVAYIADPALRKSCLDGTKPAPILTDELPAWK